MTWQAAYALIYNARAADYCVDAASNKVIGLFKVFALPAVLTAASKRTCLQSIERLQSVSADLSSLSGMLAAYVNLPELGLRKLGLFNPFIGGGIGAARVAIGETRMTFPKTTTIVPGTSRTGLTWMLTAGLGMSLGGERTMLDLAWRYTDYGVIETGEGMGRVEWRDGSREPLALELAPTRAKLRNHGLRLSLRYAF